MVIFDPKMFIPFVNGVKLPTFLLKGRGQKKNGFIIILLGLSPKLWVGGGQES